MKTKTQVKIQIVTVKDLHHNKRKMILLNIRKIKEESQILNGLFLEDSASINYINTFCFY